MLEPGLNILRNHLRKPEYSMGWMSLNDHYLSSIILFSPSTSKQMMWLWIAGYAVRPLGFWLTAQLLKYAPPKNILSHNAHVWTLGLFLIFCTQASASPLFFIGRMLTVLSAGIESTISRSFLIAESSDLEEKQSKISKTTLLAYMGTALGLITPDSAQNNVLMALMLFSILLARERRAMSFPAIPAMKDASWQFSWWVSSGMCLSCFAYGIAAFYGHHKQNHALQTVTLILIPLALFSQRTFHRDANHHLMLFAAGIMTLSATLILQVPLDSWSLYGTRALMIVFSTIFDLLFYSSIKKHTVFKEQTFLSINLQYWMSNFLFAKTLPWLILKKTPFMDTAGTAMFLLGFVIFLVQTPSPVSPRK